MVPSILHVNWPIDGRTIANAILASDVNMLDRVASLKVRGRDPGFEGRSGGLLDTLFIAETPP